MSASDPLSRIVGPAQVYIASVGTAAPAVNATPGASWTLLGATEGDQQVSHEGALEYFFDNDHQGPVKAVRPEEMKMISFTLVNLTLEMYSRILNAVADLVDDGAGSPKTRTMPLKRGFIPTEYAMLFKGASHSPYGDFPAMYVLPRGVFGDDPLELTYTKEGGVSAALECEFVALEDDDTATEANRLGYLIAQTS